MECLALAYNNNIIDKTSNSSRCLCFHRLPPPSWQCRRVRPTHRETLPFPSVFLAIIGINQIWSMATFKWYKWPIRQVRRRCRYYHSYERCFAASGRPSVLRSPGTNKTDKRVAVYPYVAQHISTGIVFPQPLRTHMYAYEQISTQVHIVPKCAQRKRERERESARERESEREWAEQKI